MRCAEGPVPAGELVYPGSDWMDLARIKLCLCAVGILLGAAHSQHRKAAALGAGVVFAATYLPLMGCFFALVRRERLKR